MIMRNRIAGGLSILMLGLIALLGDLPPSAAQEKQPPKETKLTAPQFLYGHDLKVRPGGETDWVKANKIGVEVFKDEATKTIVAISETGAISVVPAGPVGSDKTCKWLTAHDLATRKAGELEFTQKTKRFGVEMFRDLGSNRLLYVSENGNIAFAPITAELVTDRGPKWHHALEPRVRAPDQSSFDNARKFGLEVFKDENTGGLIYITEVGSIATAKAPPSPPDPKKIAPPKTAYGLVLRVRGANEENFTDKTKKIGVEVFEDPNANTLFYLTETGHVAAVPNPGGFLPDARGVTWKSAMALKARKGGVKEFETARKFGIEVFQDNRTGNWIFITETGALAVVPMPKAMP
jgi:hypothetical protein